MATWIFILHLFLPTAPTAHDSAQDGAQAADDGLRYRGVEAMFAKFEREADGEG